MTREDTERLIARQIRDLKHWLDRDASNPSSSNQDLSELEEILAEEVGIERVVDLAFDLSFASIRWMNEFLEALRVDSTSDVLEKGSFHIDSRSLFFRILISAIDHPEGTGRIFEKDSYLAFLELLAFGRWDQAEWLGERIFRSDTIDRFNGPQETYYLQEVCEWEALGGDTKGIGAIVAFFRRLIPGQREKEGSAGSFPDEPALPYWKDHPLCGLVLRIWLIMTGKSRWDSFPEGLPSAGIYLKFFEYWEDEAALANSIWDACDHHMRKSQDSADDIADFFLRPYDLLPVELLALKTLRGHLGLATPWPDHPLLGTPFVRNLPAEFPPSGDELIRQVQTAAKRVFPDFERD